MGILYHTTRKDQPNSNHSYLLGRIDMKTGGIYLSKHRGRFVQKKEDPRPRLNQLRPLALDIRLGNDSSSFLRPITIS